MGEGFITAIEKNDSAALFALGAELVALVSFTIGMSTVALQDDYVERVVGREALIQNAKYPNEWTPKTVEAPYELPPMTSVTPGVGVSEPVTYEMYVQERARIEAREKAEKDALWASSFSQSLKSMSASDTDASSPSFQVYAAKNPSTAWTAKPSSQLAWDSASAASLQANAASVAAADASRMSLPFGAAYSPVLVKSGTYTAIEYPSPTDSNAVQTIVTPIQASPVPSVVAAAATADAVAPLSAVDPTTEAIGVAVRPAFVGQPVTPEYAQSWNQEMNRRPKPAIDFRVDGYRFKPETRSVIGSSPHPGGVFTFKADTSMMIKSPNEPKPNPVAYPVEGFKFGDDTKTFIAATERTAVVAPEVMEVVAPPPRTTTARPPEPVVSSSFSNVVSAMPDGSVPQPFGNAPTGSGVSRPGLGGSSYLEALNRGTTVSSGSSDAQSPIDASAAAGSSPVLVGASSEPSPETISRPKPAIDFRVDGYRFKPETQSAIISSPHPGGTFTFKADTSMMIKSSNEPKPKPVAYPVEGFKFGDSTKTVIQSTDRIAVVAPEVKEVAVPPTAVTTTMASLPPEPIVSPSFSTSVDVVPPVQTGGVPQPLNGAPTGNAVSRPYRGGLGGSSYLEALNRGSVVSSSDSDVQSPMETTAATPDLVGASSAPSQRATTSGRGSYLDSL
jgi:hypothetical protein